MVGEVGVADVGGGQVGAHEGFDEGGVDADGDVGPDPAFGPVVDRS